MSLKYEELFKATLSMFALDASGGSSSFTKLTPENIHNLFKNVLEADQLCYKDYRSKKSAKVVHTQRR